MKVSVFLKMMGIITVMALLYIHLQMQIYNLAYQSKKNANHVDQLAERNVTMRNDILRLKSSDNMGRELLVKEKNYRFLSKSNVVEVEASQTNPLSGVIALAGLKF